MERRIDKLDRRRRSYAGRVLFVSRCSPECEEYADYLRSQGFCVLEVPTAAAAYYLASHVALAAIVTEATLRGDDDGISLTRRLKHDARLHSLPIVIFTGLVFGSIREASQSAGCDLFLARPCQPEVLSRELTHVIAEASRARRHLAHRRRSPAAPRPAVTAAAVQGLS